MKNSLQTSHSNFYAARLRQSTFLQTNLFRIALAVIRHLVHDATLTIRCADQERDFTINKGQGAHYRLWLDDHRTLWRLLKNPDPGAGEAFMDAQWKLELGDTGQFLTLLACGRQLFFKSVRGKLYEVLAHCRNLNFKHDVSSSYHHAQSHYDLGNDLYETFLDEDMNYSCAFFRNTSETLEQAQLNKLKITSDRLKVEPGMRVLDIGCGWGGTCRYLAGEKQARVTGITLAENQISYAERHSRNLPHSPNYILQDYREHADVYAGIYDRIVSIGMLEHVGRENLGTYFQTVARLLRPGGRAVIHSIVGPEKSRGLQLSSPWLKRYIFPGGYVPEVPELLKAVKRSELQLASEVCIHDSFNYAETLRRWRTRFQMNRSTLDPARYDERFMRMWTYYFCMCEAMFQGHGCRVAQLILRREAN